MRILITGGAGFQGSHLATRWVNTGHEVTILNTYSRRAVKNIEPLNGRISVVWGSVTDSEIVDKTVREQDVVVHLAAHINVDESLSSPGSSTTVNWGGTLNVLEAVRKNNARMIYASSCEVYGYANHSLVTEEAELRPHSPYAASKAGADRMCFAYYKSFGLNITIVRPSNVYGERQKSGKGGAVIPIFVSLAMAGKPLVVFGTGAQRREYLNIDDLVDAYDLILGQNDLAGKAINVGTGETPSIGEIASFISRETGVPVNYGPARPGEVAGFALDSSKIRSLGFKSRVQFWDGLARYVKWKKDNPDS